MGGPPEGNGLRGSVPWGMGQSLWTLVNRSGNKKDRTNLGKLSVLLLAKLAQGSPERWALLFLTRCHSVENRLKATAGEESGLVPSMGISCPSACYSMVPNSSTHTLACFWTPGRPPIHVSHFPLAPHLLTPLPAQLKLPDISYELSFRDTLEPLNALPALHPLYPLQPLAGHCPGSSHVSLTPAGLLPAR